MKVVILILTDLVYIGLPPLVFLAVCGWWWMRRQKVAERTEGRGAAVSGTARPQPPSAHTSPGRVFGL
jgi:hypothetical protein